LLKAVQIRRFEEEATADCEIAPIVGNELAILERALLKVGTIARVEDGPRHELVRRQQIGQQAMVRAVELFEEANEELLAELVGALGVDDANVEDALAG